MTDGIVIDEALTADVDEFDGDLDASGGAPLPSAADRSCVAPDAEADEDDDGTEGAETIEGMPDDLLSDDWSRPQPAGTAAAVRELPLAFVEAYKPTLASRSFAPADVTMVAYTRESSDDQTENSQPRQIGNVRKYAKGLGRRISRFYSDLGVSGTSTHGRHQFHEMMAAARRREFKVVVFEHLDRFSRSLPDILEAYEELRDLGIEMHDAKQGRLDLAHIVIMGYLGVEGRVRFLDLCKGGKRNAVAKGLVMHYPAYGYRRHPKRRGVHLVVPERAETVREIFGWVASGVGSKRIADELTIRGILSPRQCQRLDHGEAPDERSLPWDAMEIRNIVRNPLYAGWNVWGRTTPRRDRKTKRIVGHDVRPREDWVVSRVPSLIVVSEELQAAAMASLKRRSFGGASSANRAGTRLLAGCIRCAGCGSPMHVGLNNARHLVYYCSEHRSSRIDRCEVASTVRLEYVERAVIATVAARAGAVGDEVAYRERFTAAFAAGDAARKRRIAEIDRSLVRIRDDLKASYIAMTRRTGVPEDVIAEVNAGLQARIDQLTRVRTDLVAVPAPAQAFAGLATIAGGLELMGASIPFRPVDPQGEILAQCFRRLVGPVFVHPRDANSIVRLEMRLDRDRVTNPKGFKAETADAARTMLVIDVAAELRREAEGRFATAYAETLAAAQAGVHALPDAAWAVAEPLVREVDLDMDGVVVDARTLLEGTLLVLKTKGALSRVPEKYGDADVFHKALKRLIYANAWDEVVAAWRAQMPSVLAGAETARLDTTSYARAAPKRREGKLAKWSAEEKRKRLSAVEAAIAAETDPITRGRLEAVRARLKGMSPSAAADALGVKLGFVYRMYSEYRLSDIAGVRGAKAKGVVRRVPKWKPTVFTPEANAKLEKIVERKVDGDGNLLTFKTVVKLLREGEPKVVCEVLALREALSRLGIDLPSYVRSESHRSVALPNPTPRPQAVKRPREGSERRREPGHGTTDARRLGMAGRAS